MKKELFESLIYELRNYSPSYFLPKKFRQVASKHIRISNPDGSYTHINVLAKQNGDISLIEDDMLGNKVLASFNIRRLSTDNQRRFKLIFGEEVNFIDYIELKSLCRTRLKMR
ncbi:hypothetical protein [Proteus mirabilis]|uniref:hypothetical protein n=1 Tax=Proteus mirabilis TaxID=584 RepID=UPI0034D597D9